MFDQELALGFANSFINGNKNTTIQEILASKHAALYAAYVTHYLQDDTFVQASFLGMLEANTN